MAVLFFQRQKILCQTDEQCIFWKTIENVRKHRNIKLVTTERRKIN